MRVYCIDDDQAILRWLVTNVEWESYDCQVVGYSTQPMEALSYLEREMVDLLITDISMPEMSGLELIKEAKKTCPWIAVIIISAYSEFQYVKEALKYGVINYLLKPIDTSELYDCLRIAVTVHERRKPDGYRRTDITFQHSVLRQMIMGGYEEEQFVEKCALAGISLANLTLRLMVVAVSEKDRERIETEIKQLRPSEIAGYYCFWDVNMNLVILALGEMEGLRSLERKMEEFVLEEGQCDLFSCMGAPLDNYRKLTESYQACCDFLNAKVLFGCRTVNLEEYPYERYQTVLKDDNLQQLLGALRAGESERIGQSIWKLVEGYHSQERRKMIMCLGVFLIRTIRRQYPSLEIKEPESSLEDQCTTAKMLDWINSFYMENVRKEKETGQYSYVSLVIREVTEHYSDKELSLQTLAERCGVTTAYLGKLFCAETGEFFRDFLLRTRLNAAENLLMETERNIGEISRAVGFSSQSYFNKVFLKNYKMSPMELRGRLRSREKK